MNKVLFVGAGPGAPDLITVRGMNALAECDTVIYAGSLVSPELLKYCKDNTTIHDSAPLNIEQIIEIIVKDYSTGKKVVRLHTGDPSIYGAILEQMMELDKHNVPYEVVPGVTSLFAAASALNLELTAPEISQTVIISRAAGRTPVPESESLENLASIGGTLALYLSVNSIEDITAKLCANGYTSETPAAVVYRASWEDEITLTGNLGNICSKVRSAGISKHALILVGDVIARVPKAYSKLYDRTFEHEYREKS